MSRRHWLLAGGVLFVLLMVGCVEEPPEPTVPPEPTPTISDVPPEPHREGQPHGIGVTNQMVADALVPMGFEIEHDFNDAVQRPLIRGYASLGPYLMVWAMGNPPGVIEFSLLTRWSSEAQPPLSTILSLVDLVTPHWEEASKWVSEQIDELSGQDDATREIHSGNYVVSVSASTTISDDPLIQVSVSPRFASCADALAAQDWTTQGPVGNERGYAQWRVPSEPDPDGDRTVCESIP